MATITDRLAGLRRRAWLVVAVALCAGIAATTLGLTAPASWTARSVLTTSSDRTPEQDAYLAVGYAAFFNSASYQERLAARLAEPARVTVAARTAANSPIVYVEATADDPAVATTAATTLAAALRDDVNGGLQGDTAERVRLLQDQITPLRDRLGLPISDAERSSVQQSVNSLQNQIATVRGSTTNQLKVLALDGGVARSPDNPVTDGLFGLLGGLLAGVLLALALQAWRPRLHERADVRVHLGLETLAVLGAGNGDDVELADMVGMIALRDVPDPLTLAVTGLTPGALPSEVATRVARAWADQNGPVVLVRSPRSTHGAPADRPGLRDLLSDRGRPDPALPHDRMVVLGAGTPGVPATITRPRVAELLDRLVRGRSAVVLDAPAVPDALVDRVLCASAARTIVVVERGALAADGAATLATLRRVGADVLGAVVVSAGRSRPDPSPPVPRGGGHDHVPDRPSAHPTPRVRAGLDARD